MPEVKQIPLRSQLGNLYDTRKQTVQYLYVTQHLTKWNYNVLPALLINDWFIEPKYQSLAHLQQLVVCVSLSHFNLQALLRKTCSTSLSSGTFPPRAAELDHGRKWNPDTNSRTLSHSQNQLAHRPTEQLHQQQSAKPVLNDTQMMLLLPLQLVCGSSLVSDHARGQRNAKCLLYLSRLARYVCF